ncbi:RraA famliy [Natronincola peptidivorans]|uniref:Putative 4-hydroxy-4-methyl-2-oxoglutarate aldolase n=1 Tax=Natronincola peptidivorans TaxID=426128 RepID=A0A1I0CB36_9FIRM|nr:RraA family protein [Natronincola peptidivorans]SET16719.1 RraA famliy [Natronincola peptidivorans]
MSNVGFRIYTKINRPSRELVEAFADIPVANIADNMGRITCVDSYIKPYNEAKLLGTALTVRAPLGDNLMFHKAIDMAEPGDIIVVDGESNMNHALCGEIMMRLAMKKGIAGFLIDGCIRDVDALKDLDFAVYARGSNPKGPYKNGPGEINVPVSCGGQAVLPGDIIVGDSDGVVVIRPEDAEDLVAKGTKHNQNEVKVFEEIENGTIDRSWVDESLKAKGCEIIE